MRKQTKFGDYRSNGAAQKLAIESLQNIAKVDIGGVAGPDVKMDPALASIVALLGGSSMPVAKISNLLPWKPDDITRALALGRDEGMLTFWKEGDDLVVAAKG